MYHAKNRFKPIILIKILIQFYFRNFSNNQSHFERFDQ